MKRKVIRIRLFTLMFGLTSLGWLSAGIGQDQAQPNAPESRSDLFETDNLVAWCVVPFDSKARGPAERAAMLSRLGFTKLAYDWRQQHVESFEEEILELKKRGIDFFAFWSQHDSMFDLCEKHGIQPQFWIMIPEVNAENQKSQVEAAGRALQPLVEKAMAINCKVGLYNHGGWGGEPANMIQVCEWLREHCETESVGIVYNLHHGHAHVDGFQKTLDEMLPYLLCLNLNGMNRDAQPKILTIGQGEFDDRLLRQIKESGYQGPIGILDHRSEMDAEESLRLNLNGLAEWVENQ